ncbi:phospholipase DDHD1-like isoform X1 [Seriola lalandi dorsalis]|uniref:phospholipase DDHD1b n=1 Tax=Seriola aureovittata TaxID=2871759 RepID=UPI000C6FBA4A|nr:phospholipase DDHD1-like isoform X1 [Seriola lalandi dorsalis]XP_056261178.1 phospholipase DDHD1b [Seriola aureovittata]
MTEKPTVRQQSSENNSVSSSEWDMANDVFVSGYDDNLLPDSAAVGDPDPAQPGLDRHLPLLPQDGMMLGLAGEEYSGSSYLDIEPNYTESDGNVTTKKRIRSNSSRHRGDIVTELGPEEVRWFYKEDKRTWKPFVGHDSLKIEILYRRFCEQNPDKVKRPVDPTEAEGREAARSGDVQPESGAVDSVSVRAEPSSQRGGGQRRSMSEETKDLDDTSIIVEAVCVRGGLYEVDIREKECYPVYWNQQDRIPVMRGQWFIDGTWLPLEEDESDLIELEHLARFRGQQMRDTYEMEAVTTTVDSKDAVHSLKLSRSHVDWHSVDEVYLYSDATTSKIARTVTQKLGFSKASSSGTRLHRGYVEEAAPEDTPPETTHIVFVVHGIGQKMDQGRIIRNTSMMRDAARKMEEKHFSDRTTEHVEFLPVEWRSKLALDGDTVDSITPDKVRGLRDMLNSSAMDIMYYTSPLYRDEITRGLTLELNRLYSLFCSRNPDFEKNGKVSIVSHSLGCVITFDIMTGWDPVRFHHQEAPDPEETKVRWPSDEERHLQEQLRLTHLRLRDLEDQFQGLQTSSCVAVPALRFKVENFFCMGSPLAVFLALRGIRPGNNSVQDHILPTTICKRLFNIFHPTDPVAYRLEPLILKHYSNIAPVQIHWYNTTSPTPYDQIRPTLINPPKETASVSDSESIPSPCTSPPQARRHYGESITNLGKASIMGAASLGKGIGGILFSRFSRSSSQVGGVEEEPSDCEGGASEVENVASGEEGVAVADSEEKDKQTEEERREVEAAMSQSTSAVMDSTSLELERRVDFELREGLVESRYWSAVTSHTAYWCSYDVALFLLTFMYRPQEQAEPAEDNPDTS